MKNVLINFGFNFKNSTHKFSFSSSIVPTHLSKIIRHCYKKKLTNKCWTNDNINFQSSHLNKNNPLASGEGSPTHLYIHSQIQIRERCISAVRVCILSCPWLLLILTAHLNNAMRSCFLIRKRVLPIPTDSRLIYPQHLDLSFTKPFAHAAY